MSHQHLGVISPLDKLVLFPISFSMPLAYPLRAPGLCSLEMSTIQQRSKEFNK